MAKELPRVTNLGSYKSACNQTMSPWPRPLYDGSQSATNLVMTPKGSHCKLADSSPQ